MDNTVTNSGSNDASMKDIATNTKAKDNVSPIILEGLQSKLKEKETELIALQKELSLQKQQLSMKDEEIQMLQDKVTGAQPQQPVEQSFTLAKTTASSRSSSDDNSPCVQDLLHQVERLTQDFTAYQNDATQKMNHQSKQLKDYQVQLTKAKAENKEVRKELASASIQLEILGWPDVCCNKCPALHAKVASLNQCVQQLDHEKQELKKLVSLPVESWFHKKFDDLEAELQNKMQEMLGEIQQKMADKMADACSAVGDALSETLKRGIVNNMNEHDLIQQCATPARNTTPSTTRPDKKLPAATLPKQRPVLPVLNPPPRLSPFYASLSLMWEEWHGTGGKSTKDKPIPGGFEKLEQMHKSKWRKHLDAAQSRQFTRIHLIIGGIKRMAELSNLSVELARDQLESEWSRKKSPEVMVKYLQELGYIKKTKPRGKASVHHKN